MTTESEKRKVVLVDDSPEFLEAAVGLLQELSGGAWDISTCSSGGDAIARLQQAPADLIALDVNMPVLDGLQLLGLLQRRFPSVQKAVLSGEATSEQRAACFTAGAELVLDKPADPNGWRSVYSAVDSLLSAPKEEGFHGVLRKVSLPDVIQMECLASNSSILGITGAGVRGRLYIKAGQIIHGEIGDLTGVEALNTLLCLPGGSFHLLPFSDPGQETISSHWEHLLLDAARVRDEGQGTGTPGDPVTEPGTLPDVVAKLSPAPVSTKDSSLAETTTGMRPVVKETLICSLEGDVLYDWNCPSPSERISLLEFITKRAGAMAASLPLGTFERLESVHKGTRCVAKIDGNEALFVRIQSVLSGSPGVTATP